ncbi:hypothetical protein M422DRAFT_231923 [Sphaerobolus stellatus SS14]|uniref:GYF domain-containing protein n=1 Tax=Sphaerobolus stellatus (strain SS14) TaxID=990650 RepID=A0A0C9V6U1_SPHS4|nr:hypothetical protein M422DRAFT_231923 [Sphaerobolus stellatus SS14]
MAPKRAAASGDVPDVSSSKKPAQKRTRFASPGDDPAVFAEEVDAALEDPMGTRRGRVKLEGYESDSTDDGEGVVESRKKKGKDEDDEDEDMFAMGEEEEKEEAAADKKKKKEFLRLGDIEGQEFGDAKGSGDELSDDDEPEDEDDAERRKKAGMGFEISSFNMREEMEEGKFDADGTFIRTYDPHGVHDRWMEGVDERTIKKARKQKKLRERQEREKEAREAQSAISQTDAERELINYLQKGESVVEALQRLGAVQRKLKAKAKQLQPKKPPNGMEVDAAAQAANNSAISPIQESITRITDLASTLMAQNTDIYSTTYEELLRSVRKQIGSDWTPQPPEYEYQWAVSSETDQNSQIYGPYKLDDMKSWYGANYFGEDGEKIRVRKVGDNNWHGWDDVVF